MKRFKVRFSYYLILGLIGIILQFIAFFSGSNMETSISSFTSSSSNASLVSYLAPQYLFMVSHLFIGGMFMGYFFGIKEKYSKQIAYLSLAGVVMQVLLIAITVTYVIFAVSNQTQLYSSSTGNIKGANAIILIRYILLILQYMLFTGFGLILLFSREHSKLSRVSLYCFIFANVLTALYFIVVLATNGTNQAYYFLTNYIPLSSVAPYSSDYPIFNSFTNAQITRLTYISQEVAAKGLNSTISNSSWMAIINIITYYVNYLVFFFFVSVQMIESFDIDRDEEPMRI